MGTIIDYMKEYGDYTFLEKPVNEVDSLVLSQFSYLKFDGLAPGLEDKDKFVTFDWLESHPEKDRLFADERYRKDNIQLYENMCSSARFGSLKIGYYVNLIEPEKETQFSAVTLLSDQWIYVAYRGTDETIVGWKEDFNLAFSEPVPGQLRSVEYLNAVADNLEGMLYVGGHSKGGNFAVYASMNCRGDIKERICAIYNHDGPGFRPEIREAGYDQQIDKKVVKVIPHSSLVGMILGSPEEEYIVVESKTFGLLQHNPYTWLVRDGKFVEVKDIYKGTRFRDDTLNQWILSLDEEHMHSLVDTLYMIVSAASATTLAEFSKNRKSSMAAMITAAKELDEPTTLMIKKIVTSLFEIAGERMKVEMQEMAGGGKSKKRSRPTGKSQDIHLPPEVQRERK